MFLGANSRDRDHSRDCKPDFLFRESDPRAESQQDNKWRKFSILNMYIYSCVYLAYLSPTPIQLLGYIWAVNLS